MKEKVLIFETGESKGFEISREWYEKAREYIKENDKPYTFEVSDPEECLYYEYWGDGFLITYGIEHSPDDITWNELIINYLDSYPEEELNDMGITIPEDLNKLVYFTTENKLDDKSYNPRTHHPLNYSNMEAIEEGCFQSPKDRAVNLFSGFGELLGRKGIRLSRLWVENQDSMVDSWDEVYVDNYIGISFLTEYFKKEGIGVRER